MSLSAQAKVLRALQENKITRVGGEKRDPRGCTCGSRDPIRISKRRLKIRISGKISIIA